MKTKLIIPAFCVLTTLFSGAQAFSFNDLIGSNKDEKPESASGLNIDSIAKSVIGSQTNPLITLAATKLGIPTKYIPQIEMLYNMFMSKGDVTSNDVSNSKGLGDWVKSSDKFNSTTLASAITHIFATQK